MVYMDDKTFFKAMKREVAEYSSNISESFPYFCIRIFWDDLSRDNIEDALKGLSGNDESIDAFFVDEENKEINIIQCKSCVSEKDQKALKKEWLAYLVAVPDKLKDYEFINNHTNDRLREISEEFIRFEKRNFAIRFHFFHLGRSIPNILKHHSNIEYYDWGRIMNEYLEYQSKLDRTEPPYIEVQLTYGGIKPDISGKHKTFVSVITGNEVINLRQKYRYKLFDKNLRFGLGKNKINKGIIETALGEPDGFYFYNNGITITSKGFRHKPTNGRLKIEYPQIINGAQTVSAIYAAYKVRKNRIARTNTEIDAEEKTKDEFKRIKLLFRVIEDREKDGKKTSLFEEKVIRYNNTQNSIKETDFCKWHRDNGPRGGLVFGSKGIEKVGHRLNSPSGLTTLMEGEGCITWMCMPKFEDSVL